MNQSTSTSDARPRALRQGRTYDKKKAGAINQRGKAAQDTSLGKRAEVRTRAFSPADIKGFPPGAPAIFSRARPVARRSTSSASSHTSTMHNYHDRPEVSHGSAERLSRDSLHNVQILVHCAKVTRRLFSHTTTLSSTTTTTTTLERESKRDTQADSLHNVQKFVHCARDFSRDTPQNEVGAA